MTIIGGYAAATAGSEKMSSALGCLYRTGPFLGFFQMPDQKLMPALCLRGR